MTPDDVGGPCNLTTFASGFARDDANAFTVILRHPT
jgi:hypothetical protein